MNKSEILRAIRNGTGKIALPETLELKEDSGVVSVSLTASSVIKNMQEDAAAFEGWILGIKAIMDGWKFCLHWKAPEDVASRHYQRFLYRVDRFNSFFGGKDGWFSFGDECSLGPLKIKHGDIRYQLNCPAPGSRTNESMSSAENLLENTIVKDRQSPLKKMFAIDKLERQLPMGVFDGEVSKQNAIFTGGKSAVDIWGISPDKTTIIFELKAGGNEKVGVISELFFYAMVLADEQKQKFYREGWAGEAIRETRTLKAMILAPKIHPLISRGVFDLLNAPRKGIVEFGYVEMTPSFDFSRVF